MVGRKKYVTVKEIAEYLQVTKQTISNWINSGKLKADRLPSGRIRVLLSDFLSFLIKNNLHVDKKFFGLKVTKVVVIDDDESVLQVLKTFFLSTFPDCNVEYMNDPIEGLLKIGEVRPDVVILDIKMERMNGIDVCRRILENENLSNMKIIVISGYIGEYKDELDKLNIYGRLSKPFRYSELENLLRPIIFDARLINS